jgi:hypothetical protein
VRLRRGVWLAASLAALPGVARAQGDGPPYLGCPLIRAMANVDAGNFRSIRLSMTPPFLAVGRTAIASAQPAADCRAVLETDQADFDCSWNGSDGVSPALFDRVVGEVSQCLRVRPPTPTGPEASDHMRVAKRSVFEIRAHRGVTSITVRLIGPQEQSNAAGARQWLVLEFNYRVQGPSRVD